MENSGLDRVVRGRTSQSQSDVRHDTTRSTALYQLTDSAPRTYVAVRTINCDRNGTATATGPTAYTSIAKQAHTHTIDRSWPIQPLRAFGAAVAPWRARRRPLQSNSATSGGVLTTEYTESKASVHVNSGGGDGFGKSSVRQWSTRLQRWREKFDLERPTAAHRGTGGAALGAVGSAAAVDAGGYGCGDAGVSGRSGGGSGAGAIAMMVRTATYGTRAESSADRGAVRTSFVS